MEAELVSSLLNIKIKCYGKIHSIKRTSRICGKDAVAFFEKNNKAAGTRLRNALQQTKVLAQDIRNEVTSKKNTK